MTAPKKYSLLVQRFVSDGEATLSRVYLTKDDAREFLCHGLEDEYRSVKVRGETRIPAGIYELGFNTWGPKFHHRYKNKIKNHIGMIWVKNVPGFEGILWHIGNYETDTDGCLLLGKGDTAAMAVWSSDATYKRVYAKIAPMIRDGIITHVEYRDEGA